MTCQNFSLSHYREIIQLAKDKGYVITALRNYQRPNTIKNIDKIIYLRHDIDFSLEYAQEMALIEVQESVQSTYHIMLQSEFYNALAPDNANIIRYISRLGHEIGYHCDSNNMVEDEYKILEQITGKKVYSYSRHFPLVSLELGVYPYLLYVMDLEMKYLSDSCRNFREGCLCQNLGKGYDKIQYLTHPLWYCSNTNSRREAIEKVRQNIRFNTDNHIHAFHAQVPEYLAQLQTTCSQK